MTFTEKQITNYIETRISRMDSHFNWMKDELEGWTIEHKKNWAKECVKEEYTDGFGALSFTQIYLEGIDEKTYDKLHKKLSDHFYDLVDQIDHYYR